MMSTETFLLIEVGPGVGARHEVAPGTTIGRERCDVLLADEEASRRHAAIREVDEGIAIEDLGSRNGTFVNGERIDAPRPLVDGDTVQIGTTAWRFQVSIEAETAFGQAPPPTGAEAGPSEASPAEQPAEEPAEASAATPSSGSLGSRGDVPAPEVMPSAVRKIPAPQAAAPPAFPSAPRRRIRGSAARRGGAVLGSYAVVLLTAAAVIAYFATR